MKLKLTSGTKKERTARMEQELEGVRVVGA